MGSDLCLDYKNINHSSIKEKRKRNAAKTTSHEIRQEGIKQLKKKG